MKMKLWALLGFILLLSTSNSTTPAPEIDISAATPTNGADEINLTTSAPTTDITSVAYSMAQVSQCTGKNDFDPCDDPENAGCKENSRCSCKNQKHFCRCNNDEGKWYIGENCEQEWTVLTFALVASLPGVALAIIVGVAVHCVHHSRKKGSAARVKSSQKQKAEPDAYFSKNESSPADGYSNAAFASDFQSGQKPQPASGRPDSLPMASQPYSAHSYASGQPSRNQSFKNPYASYQPNKNPYNSMDRYDDYRNSMDPPAWQNGITRGSQSGYQQAGLSTPDYSSRSQFPRAQMGRQY